MTQQPSCRGTTGTALPRFLSPSAKLGVHLWAEDALTRTREEGIPGGVLHPSQEGLRYAAGSLQRPAACPRGGGTGLWPLPSPLRSCPTPRGPGARPVGAESPQPHRRARAGAAPWRQPRELRQPRGLPGAIGSEHGERTGKELAGSGLKRLR